MITQTSLEPNCYRTPTCRGSDGLRAMPRACTVEIHALGYKRAWGRTFLGCHGLVPWWLTLVTPKLLTENQKT